MQCASCGAELNPGDRFCAQCGSPQLRPCPGCGQENAPGNRFCPSCGTPLASGNPASAPTVASAQSAVAERRLVSVLFADLVGFTTLSEHRDPEEVRELLSQYFERSRTLIERYGGTVEKFIGDAVMAVWGTPTAREDDAERAVRAALGLVSAVELLGEEVGMPALRARAGVLTGRAAVEVGAEGQGMVLGDTVNTASRLQSIAEPGTVLVDDTTRRASEAAIAYEDAGLHEVKGREQPVHAWTGLRVVAGVRGARRGAGLEAPLVGRARELQLIIESSEASGGEHRARMVTVVGEAGSGKSRLLWEYFKYIDGVQSYVRWHQGRCLSYGEGVAYWALAEMVRARAGIVEEEDPASARVKLHASVEEFVPDERERRLVEPRLAHLLGLEQRVAPDRADLFSGWRLFFERIAATEPVVMAFEDLQWADSGLLDFIDYLLEWSADFPIFVLALGRPELLRSRPGWTPTITLEPLQDTEMAELLGALVPGLPAELAEQIRRRAEGVPLYAVETVRMLLDRGLVTQAGNQYVVSGDVTQLEVPETLQALVAARLDNLESAERVLLQDAAVIGQAFTPAALTAITDRPAADVGRLLESLVAKQVLDFVDDPRSPERGQYVFLQALLRSVALGTLSRRDRKARHLAIARHLQEAWGDEAGDIAEVLASHYLDAVAADPEAPDAHEIRASACQTLAEAGRRALSLALGPEARRYFERAGELAEDPADRGRLLREAGMAARMSGELADAHRLLSSAGELLERAGVPREAARVEGLLGDVMIEEGQHDEAVTRLDRAHAVLDDGTDDEALADLATRRARAAFMVGDHELALELADTALRIADANRLIPILTNSLITKAIVFAESARPEESTALLTHAVALAVEQDLATEAIRGYYNLGESLMDAARFVDALEQMDRGLVLARRRGDRQGERMLLSQGVMTLLALGHWDEALQRVESLQRQEDLWAEQALVFAPFMLAARGDTAGLEAVIDRIQRGAEWVEGKVLARAAGAVIVRETVSPAEAVQGAIEGALAPIASRLSYVPVLFSEAVETAFAADQPERVAELLAHVDALQSGQLIPMLDAEASVARGRLAAANAELTAADQHFRRAIGLFREMGTPFSLARAQLAHAELLVRMGDESDEARPLAREAAQIFEELAALPWLQRVEELLAQLHEGQVVLED